MAEVFLNGVFLPIEEASISVLDRGFLFGDGVYEVVPVFSGCLFRAPEHLRRLQRSLEAIRMEPPLHDAAWLEVLNRLIAQYPGQNQALYLQVTRGAAARRDHVIPAKVTPTVFAMTTALPPNHPDAGGGAAAITQMDTRWQRCDIKAITLLANVLMKTDAVEQGALETLLLRDGWLTEGSVSTAFVVASGQVMTPPAGPLLLPGITRDLIIELAAAQGAPVQECPITEAQLRQADEIWVASSTRELVPIVRLDGQPVGSGSIGPQWRRYFGWYQDYKNRCLAGNA